MAGFFILITSGYLLILSGSKTGLMLAGGYLSFSGFRALLFMRVNMFSVGLFLGMIGLIYYWDTISKNFYVLFKILNILIGGLFVATSFKAD